MHMIFDHISINSKSFVCILRNIKTDNEIVTKLYVNEENQVRASRNS